MVKKGGSEEMFGPHPWKKGGSAELRGAGQSTRRPRRTRAEKVNEVAQLLTWAERWHEALSSPECQRFSDQTLPCRARGGDPSKEYCPAHAELDAECTARSEAGKAVENT